jgi:hypothetical protein
MAPTLVPNVPPITLQPTGVPAPVSSSTILNPNYLACDPLNGNYFVASGRDLVTFWVAPSVEAPAWSATVTYTQGQVVNYTGTPYIATAATANLDQIPTGNPTYWTAYTGSTLNITSAPDACTGRTANVIGYSLPVADVDWPTPNTPVTEFLVLASSVFTQTTGQVLFQASSNLVNVYVRSM